MKREVLILLAVALLILGASISPTLYALGLAFGSFVMLAWAGFSAVQLFGGAARHTLDFVAGLGGVLLIVGYVAGLLWPEYGQDLPFLVRCVGMAFLALPVVVARLTAANRAALGVPHRGH